MTTDSLPSRSREAWRYADLEALGRIWNHDTAQKKLLHIPAHERSEMQIIAPEPENGVALHRLDITLDEGAYFALHVLAAGSDYGRIEVTVTLHRGAHFELGGAILACGEQTQEIVTHIRHLQPEASSNQTIRSVLAGKATGTFLGKVSVARDAQKTDAQQSVKSMLLDRGATANTRPELEILADDVQCAHGATVGELDESALFYMGSRGIPPQIARKLMLQAFIADAFVSLSDEIEHDKVETMALLRLEAML